jgi:hypothetical protein
MLTWIIIVSLYHKIFIEHPQIAYKGVPRIRSFVFRIKIAYNFLFVVLQPPIDTFAHHIKNQSADND